MILAIPVLLLRDYLEVVEALSLLGVLASPLALLLLLVTLLFRVGLLVRSVLVALLYPLVVLLEALRAKLS